MQRNALSRFLQGLVVATLPVGAAGCCSQSSQTEQVVVDALFTDALGDGGVLPPDVCNSVCKSDPYARPHVLSVDNCRAVQFNNTTGAVTLVSCKEEIQSCFSVFAGGRPPSGLRARGEVDGNLAGAFFAALAHLEGAAVEGFAQLARELSAHGAPERLVNDALRAGRDERRHSRIAAALARRAGVEPPPVVVDPVELRSLVEVAVDNAREGCVTETFGAVVTLWQGKRAGDPVVRRAFAKIAVDELRHAELAASVAEWIAPRLTRAERERVRQSMEECVNRLAAGVEHEPAQFFVEEIGLPPRDAQRALFAEMRARLWS
jgi:hypothetical protein